MTTSKLADRPEDLVSELKCCRPFLTGHTRRRPRPGSMQKGLEFQLQGLFLLCPYLFSLDARGLTGFHDPTRDHALASLVVHREVAVALEQTEFPHPGRRDTTRRQIRHAPASKLDPGIGNIDVGSQHGDSRGADVFDRSEREGQHDVQIMDHEIQDDIDIGTTLPKGAEPVTFDEAWLSDVGTYRPNDRVEALDVSNLQEPIAASG